jgi:uncharacterized LabA/DUF88 family protein
MADRAILFVDGNNWYHSLKRNKVGAPGELDYAKISRKLVGPRDWIQTRYYVGMIPQAWNAKSSADQRRFLARLEATDPRICHKPGRIELRHESNPLAEVLTTWLNGGPQGVDIGAVAALRQMADDHTEVLTPREKGVDVELAVDLIRLATEDRYDAAYVLSADSDYTPAVATAKAAGKTIYAASPDSGFELSKAVQTFIKLPKSWFQDCYTTTTVAARLR